MTGRGSMNYIFQKRQHTRTEGNDEKWYKILSQISVVCMKQSKDPAKLCAE